MNGHHRLKQYQPRLKLCPSVSRSTLVFLYGCGSVALWDWECCYMGLRVLLHGIESVATWDWECCYMGLRVLLHGIEMHERVRVDTFTWERRYIGMRVQLHKTVYVSLAIWVWYGRILLHQFQIQNSRTILLLLSESEHISLHGSVWVWQYKVRSA